MGWHKTGNIAADNCKQKNGNHHDQSVFDIQIFVFAIGIGRNSTGKHIRGQGDTDCHIWINAKEGDQYGTDDGCSTHACKTGSETCSHTG